MTSVFLLLVTRASSNRAFSTGRPDRSLSALDGRFPRHGAMGIAVNRKYWSGAFLLGFFLGWVMMFKTGKKRIQKVYTHYLESTHSNIWKVQFPDVVLRSLSVETWSRPPCPLAKHGLLRAERIASVSSLGSLSI